MNWKDPREHISNNYITIKKDFCRYYINQDQKNIRTFECLQQIIDFMINTNSEKIC